MDNVGRIEKIDGNKAVISVKRVSACGDSCKSCSSACKVKPLKETAVCESMHGGVRGRGSNPPTYSIVRRAW